MDVRGLMDEWFDYLKVEKQVSPLTIRNYRHYMARFLHWEAGTGASIQTVADIDQNAIRKYRVWLADYVDDKGENLKPVTQSYHVIALRSWLRWLVKNDYETLSPDKVDLPKAKGRRLEFLNQEQVERFLGMPTISTPQGLRDKAILEVLFSTGLRVSELVALDRDQIDMERREFGVKGKGGRVRVVFLSERAVKWLERYTQQRDDEWDPLFINYRGATKNAESEGSAEQVSEAAVKKKKGAGRTVGSVEDVDKEMLKFDPEYGETKRLTARSVQRLVKNYAKKAKLPVEITPHGVRHSFATGLLRAGADLRSVQELLGHKNIATTQIYTHVTDKRLKQVHDQFHGKE